MAITINTPLTQAQYEALRFALITQLEGGTPTPYFDTAGRITIGYGFEIDTGNKARRNEVMSEMGLTQPQQNAITALWSTQALATLRAMPAGDARNNALHTLFASTIGQTTFAMTAAQMLNVFDPIVSGKDTNAQLATGITASSYERAVLTSLNYNALYAPGNPKALIGPGLIAALNDISNPAEARAEAWYQIRYLSGTDQLKRRYIESELFGLFTDPGNVTADDAKAVYRIYTLHNAYRMNAAWDAANTAAINLAAGDVTAMQAILQQLGSAVALPAIKTLEQELTLAKTALIADLLTTHPGNTALSAALTNPDRFLATNIYLDPNRNSASAPADTNHSAMLNSTQLDATVDEIMIGEGGDDYLLGGKGDDILIGGTGYDSYLYRLGDGNDLIVDSDNRGRIILYDATGTTIIQIASGQFTQGNGNVWTNADGSITLTHNSPWTLRLADGSTITLGDTFNDGDFGIHLTQPIADDLQTSNVIEGDKKPLKDGDGNILYDSWGNILPTGNEPNRDDVIYDTPANDLILAGGADDIVNRNHGGDDVVDLGAGDDKLGTLFSAAGRLSAFGGDGRDYLGGGSGRDILQGGDGADGLYGGADNDLIYGGLKRAA